ncbi:MAG: amino acid ABC transporter substrate-binding protein [Coriobacteriia bacterium]|nr:amino acid ABC transporter substrate-binding protein [Coriobacteriia bacterium]
MYKVRRIARLVLAMGLALAIVAVAGCSSSTPSSTPSTTTSTTPDYKLVKAGVLTVGSDTAFPPFEAMNGSTAEGFDVDLAVAIAKEMGLTVNFTTQKFDTLIPQLKAGGTFDVIMSAMTITSDREKEITFSSPYIDSNQSIAVTKGKFAKVSGNNTSAINTAFTGKIIGVQSGTTGEAWAKENLKGAKQIVPFDDTLAAFSALAAGKVDAIVNDLPVSAYIVKDATRNAEIIAEIPTGEQYGIGIAQSNAGLKKAIDAALAKLKSSGQYDTIYKKWFGVAPTK